MRNLRCWFAVVALVASAAASAQYPSKAIRFVVPFPPGGPLDIVARSIGQDLNKAWGQPVLSDNRPGAGGNIGADIVAKGTADEGAVLPLLR